MFEPYSQPHKDAAAGSAAIWREITGSVAPMKKVGGNRQIADAMPRSAMFGSPWATADTYSRSMAGNTQKTTMPQSAVAASSKA